MGSVPTVSFDRSAFTVCCAATASDDRPSTAENMLAIAYGFAIALRSRSQFGRLLGLGIAANFFLYAFINMAMVMGLIPVVGVPLPLISYGGTAMLTVLVGFGLIMSVYINRDLRIGRRGGVGED